MKIFLFFFKNSEFREILFGIQLQIASKYETHLFH
jgi:hypothetical protein